MQDSLHTKIANIVADNGNVSKVMVDEILEAFREMVINESQNWEAIYDSDDNNPCLVCGEHFKDKDGSKTKEYRCFCEAKVDALEDLARDI